jgi:hypothetical protein
MRIMMLTAIAPVLAAVSPTVATAQDQPVAAVAAPAPMATPSPATLSPATPPRAKRYCVKETITGSRIPVKTCFTRDEWLAQGFDPLNPDK